MDDFKIKSHKLIYHVDRVNQWLKGENIYPIYMEVSPTSACNHRCVFCAFDYRDYKPRFLEKERFKDILFELGRLGIKSIMYAGEGEPFLHKDMAEIIKHTKNSGIDVAVASNGVLFREDIAKECLPAMTWIRFSVNAGNNESHKKIHNGGENGFNKMVENISYAVELRKKNNYSCAIGAQFLLIPENKDEVSATANLFKKIGVDYLTIKPFIKHPLSRINANINFDYDDFDLDAIGRDLEKISDDNFKVIFRANIFKKLKEERRYGECLGLPFFAEIASDGNVYTCGPYLGEEKFCYGNIYQNSFKEIWEGEKRKEVLKMVSSDLDVKKCMKCCRLDEANNYLWDLKNLPPHVNFI